MKSSRWTGDGTDGVNPLLGAGDGVLLGGGDDDGVLPRGRRGGEGVGDLPREDGEDERNAKRSRRARRAAAVEVRERSGMLGMSVRVLYGFAADSTQSSGLNR